MTWTICDRCGDVSVNALVCLCRTPVDPIAARRRYREAVARARESDRRAAERAPGWNRQAG